MPVYPGDQVRPGQVVARLDDVELGSRVGGAAAAAAAARANLAQMKADVLAAYLPKSPASIFREWVARYPSDVSRLSATTA